MENLISYSSQDREGIQVGRLALWFDLQDTQTPILFKPSQQKFIINHQTEVEQTSVFSDEIHLSLQQQLLSRQDRWEHLICRTEIWELWQDTLGYFVFYNPMQPLLRQVLIDPHFQGGILRGDFSGQDPQLQYPLPQDLMIVFFVNWLAGFGDVFLHASGFIRDNKGYAMVGPSGIGKSTLAARLAGEPDLTILGEDQVLLRLIDGRFWIFGTPFHEQPQMCSPMGAPLEKLILLERKGENLVQAVNPPYVMTRLLQTAFIPYYRPQAVGQIMDHLVLLAQQIPCRSLSYQLGADVLKMILNG